MFNKNKKITLIVLTLLMFLLIIWCSPYIIHKLNMYINIPKIEDEFDAYPTNTAFDFKDNSILDDKIEFDNKFFDTNFEEKDFSKFLFCTSNEIITSSDKKYVALTFDDGPHKKYTKEMLKVLKEKDVKATFFVLGQNIDGNEELLKQMLEQDCEIGIHSYMHKLFTKISNEEIAEQILNTQELIVKATSKQATLIRPPYGSVNSRVREFINMPIVLWHLDSKDWSYLNTQKIYTRVMKQIDNYDIILMHDIFKTSVESASLIIDDLKKQGYEFVTISELNALNYARGKSTK